MRNNQPITQHEHDFPADEPLMSATDLKGIITYVNRSFAQVCKFLPSEMVGQPHNLIRHPDVPTAAYKDLWACLQQGKFWTGILKNRCKDGDFYWVRANITPIYSGGKLSGYVSVRLKPSAEEIKAAKQVYADYHRGRPSKVFFKGQLVRRGWRGYIDKARRASLRTQLWTILGGITLLWFTAIADTSLQGLDYWRATLPLGIGNLLAGLAIDFRFVRRIKPVMAQATQTAIGKPMLGRILQTMDETGVLQRAIIQSNLNLRTFIGDVDQLIGGLYHAAGEIADGSQRLSTRTEDAANHLAETANAMDDMAGSVERNAASTQEARALAQDAGAATLRAADMVADTAARIERMNAANQKIDGIVGVIDSIAFQTNILALNAAVEAARAGEAGRGFAVVAGEVRELAQRSAASAKEIGDIIREVVDLAHGSAEQVSHAVAAMDEVQERNRKVDTLIERIAEAGKRQAQGVSRVRESLVELNQVTQDNAAMAEESSAAVHGMEEQIRVLASAVDIFHNQRSTWNDESLATRRSAPAARPLVHDEPAMLGHG